MFRIVFISIRQWIRLAHLELEIGLWEEKSGQLGDAHWTQDKTRVSPSIHTHLCTLFRGCHLRAKNLSVASRSIHYPKITDVNSSDGVCSFFFTQMAVSLLKSFGCHSTRLRKGSRTAGRRECIQGIDASAGLACATNHYSTFFRIGNGYVQLLPSTLTSRESEIDVMVFTFSGGQEAHAFSRFCCCGSLGEVPRDDKHNLTPSIGVNLRSRPVITSQFQKTSEFTISSTSSFVLVLHGITSASHPSCHHMEILLILHGGSSNTTTTTTTTTEPMI